MPLYRIDRLDRTPLSDPDPATYAYRAVLRDAITGLLVTLTGAIVKAKWTDGPTFLTQFCAAWNATYTPNDWGC